jgi:hypothetical protein
MDEEKVTKIQGEINARKSLLADSDYQIIKAMENLVGCTSLAEILAALKAFATEFSDLVKKRQTWRKEINELEAELDSADSAE